MIQKSLQIFTDFRQGSLSENQGKVTTIWNGILRFWICCKRCIIRYLRKLWHLLPCWERQDGSGYCWGDTAVHQRFRKCGVAVLLALVLDFLLANVILKPLVARPRPCWINDTVELLVQVRRIIPSPPDIPWLLLRRQGLCFSQRKNWEFVVWYWPSLWEFQVVFLCTFSHRCFGRYGTWPALRICRGIFDEKADEERLMKMAKRILMMPAVLRCWKDWKQCGSVRECISEAFSQRSESFDL